MSVTGGPGAIDAINPLVSHRRRVRRAILAPGLDRCHRGAYTGTTSVRMAMKVGVSIVLTAMLAAGVLTGREMSSQPQPAATVAPAHFHHLHLNSADPAAAVDYYARAFSSVTKASLGGFEGFRTTSRLSTRSGNAYVLFTKVDSPPPTAPQSAVWHFGWNTPDSKRYLEKFRAMDLKIMPMYGDPEGTLVEISSDGLPGYLTQQQIVDARARGITPTRVGGFQYLEGPDRALIESYGDFPAERFTHIHLYAEHPACTQQWYARHLGAIVAATHLHLGPGTGDTDGLCQQPYAEPTYPGFFPEGVPREPSGYVLFDDVGLPIRPWRGPFASTRGQTVDHIAISVENLPSTLERLRNVGITVLEEMHPWGNTRAAMIEAPDRLALELVEEKE